MKKVNLKILIAATGLLATGMFFGAAWPAQAGTMTPTPTPPPRIVVVFEQSPLFADSNLLPGEEVTRYFQVTNNSGATQKIITEAIKFTHPIPNDDLSHVLTIEIKKDGNTIYGPRGLNYFYTDGEIYLSDLDNNQTAQYDVTVAFDIQAGDEWQERTTGFDILVGFQGQEGGTPPVSTGGISGTSLGSGGNPPGLSISGESVKIADASPTSVTITWLTSYAATSQVIYALAVQTYSFNLSDNAGTPPLYGYPSSTPEDINKVTSHSVVIGGLTPGTTYYYRTVSHGSLAISQEYSFTTLALQAETETLPTTAPAEKVLSFTDQTGNSGQALSQAGKAAGNELASNASAGALSSGNVLGAQSVKGTESGAASNLYNSAVSLFTLGTDKEGVAVAVVVLILVFLFVMFILRQKLYKEKSF